MSHSISPKKEEYANLQIDLSHKPVGETRAKRSKQPRNHRKDYPLVIFKSQSSDEGSHFNNAKSLAIDTTHEFSTIQEFETEIKKLLNVPPNPHVSNQNEATSSNETSGVSEDDDDSEAGLRKKIGRAHV